MNKIENKIENKYIMLDRNNMGIKFFKNLGRVRIYIEELVFSKVWDNDIYFVYDISSGDELGIDISLNIDFS